MSKSDLFRFQPLVYYIYNNTILVICTLDWRIVQKLICYVIMIDVRITTYPEILNEWKTLTLDISLRAQGGGISGTVGGKTRQRSSN